MPSRRRPGIGTPCGRSPSRVSSAGACRPREPRSSFSPRRRDACGFGRRLRVASGRRRGRHSSAACAVRRPAIGRRGLAIVSLAAGAMIGISCVTAALGAVSPAEPGHPVGDRVRVAEQLEGVNPQVVPAETAQHLGPETQRLAQAATEQHRVGLDDDAGAAVGGDEAELAAVTEGDPEAAVPRVAGRGRRASGRCRPAAGAPRATLSDLIEDLGERDGAVLHPAVVDVLGRKQVTMTIERRRASWRPRAGAPRRARPRAPKFAEHASVRGAAEPEREDDAVAALRHGCVERQHRERLGAVAEHELGQLPALSPSWPAQPAARARRGCRSR